MYTVSIILIEHQFREYHQSPASESRFVSIYIDHAVKFCRISLSWYVQIQLQSLSVFMSYVKIPQQ